MVWWLFWDQPKIDHTSRLTLSVELTRDCLLQRWSAAATCSSCRTAEWLSATPTPSAASARSASAAAGRSTNTATTRTSFYTTPARPGTSDWRRVISTSCNTAVAYFIIRHRNFSKLSPRALMLSTDWRLRRLDARQVVGPLRLEPKSPDTVAVLQQRSPGEG